MDRLFTFIIFVSFLSYCEPWFFDGIVDHGNVERCPQNIPRDNYLFAYNDTCIELIHDEHSWYDARRYCTQLHGDLVMIQDMAKQQFIMKALKTVGWDRNGVWIGGTDRVKEGHWKWVNGQSMTWGNWEKGQGPGNSGFLFSSGALEDCAVIRTDDGYKWHDYPCKINLPQFHYSSICEYKFIPTPRSTTMLPQITSLAVKTTFPSTTVTLISSSYLSTTTPTQKTTTTPTKQKPTTSSRKTPETTTHPTHTHTIWPRTTTDTTTLSTTSRVPSTMSTTASKLTTQTITSPASTTQTSTTALSTTQTSSTPAPTMTMKISIPTTQTSTTELSTTQTSTTTLRTTHPTKPPAQTINLFTTSSTSLQATTPVPSTYVSSTLTPKVTSTKLATTQSHVSASTNDDTLPSTTLIQTIRTTKAKSTFSPTPIPTMRPTKASPTTSPTSIITMRPTKASPTTSPTPNPTGRPTKAAPTTTREKTDRPTLPLSTQIVNNQGGPLRRSATGQKSTHKSSTGYIIGGVCVAVVVAGIIVALFVIRRRRISLNDVKGKVHGAENPMYSVMYDDTSIPPVGADIQINDIYEPTKYFTNGESTS